VNVSRDVVFQPFRAVSVFLSRGSHSSSIWSIIYYAHHRPYCCCVNSSSCCFLWGLGWIVGEGGGLGLVSETHLQRKLQLWIETFNFIPVDFWKTDLEFRQSKYHTQCSGIIFKTMSHWCKMSFLPRL
jgi:hypothetical protein